MCHCVEHADKVIFPAVRHTCCETYWRACSVGKSVQFGPYLEVVWAHEEVSNALSHDTHDPLIKVLRLALGCCVCHLGLYQASQAVDLQQTALSIPCINSASHVVTVRMYHMSIEQAASHCNHSSNIPVSVCKQPGTSLQPDEL